MRNLRVEQILRCPGRHFVGSRGTLDNPEAVKPDVHIFTRSKLPWLALPKDTPTFESFYNIEDVWPAASKERLRRNIAEHS